MLDREPAQSRASARAVATMHRVLAGIGVLLPAAAGAAAPVPVPVNSFGTIPLGATLQGRRFAIWLISTSAFALYIGESVLRQAQFKTSVDITMFQQAIANYAQGATPNLLVKSQEPFDILGDHFSPIMMIVAPFYRVFPSVLTLLTAQALFLAVGVHVVTRVGVRVNRPVRRVGSV